MTKPKWLTDTLCSFDEKVRVERGPQVIKLKCDDVNLSDAVTAPHYRLGGRDAMGNLIRPDEAIAALEAQGRDASELRRTKAEDHNRGLVPVENGDDFHVVDHKAKHVPFLWKIYQWQPSGQIDVTTGKDIFKFVKVDEVEGKEDALARAEAILKGEK